MPSKWNSLIVGQISVQAFFRSQLLFNDVLVVVVVVVVVFS